MALLDVTEVLTDPDFMDLTLVCERNPQSVSGTGLAQVTPQLTAFAGVVTPERGDLLERGTDAERVTGSIRIYTRFTLKVGSPGYTADIVRWRGRRFTVAHVDSWAHFGTGFVVATCEPLPLSG